MSGEAEFSLADAEATFGPEDWEQLCQGVAQAPEFSPEQREKYKALFASAPVPKPGPAADAA